jgi:hypothetical protein
MDHGSGLQARCAHLALDDHDGSYLLLSVVITAQILHLQALAPLQIL